jgi:hypothetical protein
MSKFSNYMEQAICNWIKGTTFPSAPAAVYVGLFSSDPTDANSGTEVTTTIRVAGRVAATFGTVTNGVMSNSALIDFGNAAGSASITHFGLFDAASAGNLLVHGPVTGGGTANVGNPVSFASGALIITVD